MEPLQDWASGAIAWALGTDGAFGPHLSTGGCQTCRGLVETNNGGCLLNIDYYIIAQLSKFIPQGATILSGSGNFSYPDGSGIQRVASRNPDGTRTVVIWNSFGNDIYVTVSMGCGEEWGGDVPGSSVVTWVLP